MFARYWFFRAPCLACLAVLGLLFTGLSAETPPELKALLDAKKYDEASQRIYALLPGLATGSQRLDLLRLAYDNDPDFGRLKTNLLSWLGAETDPGLKTGIARLVGQLSLVQRDFPTVVLAFDLIPDDPEAALQAAGALLLMGQGGEAKNRLVVALKVSRDAPFIERASCLLAWILWSEGDAKTGLEILKNKKTPAAVFLDCVLSRNLGLKKDDQAARDRLNREWPHSIWTYLAEPEADPAVQMDTSLLVLTGIGVAAAGDTMLVRSPAIASGKVAPGDDGPAKAIQVGLFKDGKNARKLADSLNAKGFMAQIEDDKSTQRFKVLVLIRPGVDPQTLIIQLKDQGLEGFLVF